MYPYGLVGNCQFSALIGPGASVDWMCAPRPDSPPIFGRLLDPDGGHFSIEAADSKTTHQYYLPHTPILVTEIEDHDGSSFRVTDFCPRFYQHGRIYRPISLFRIVEPLKGLPRIKIQCRPVDGWSKKPVPAVRGNSHLRFEIGDSYLRLISNMPITYLCEETAFSLKEPLYFGLTWSTSIEEELPGLSQRFLNLTENYWRSWVKHCSIPTMYQSETIRSALTLKLHCYEDTGAILAALTTSLPEEVGSTRNWDYRYCWLRDAYFVLSSFHNLGHFEEMEGFLKFILNIAESSESEHGNLKPVYRLDQSVPIPEDVHPNWRGFKNSTPVRSGNQAAEHIQNDVYGEMVLALSPIFFDERFRHLRTREHERLLGHFTDLCASNISKADAGLWELRSGWQEHTFSNLMCWAGLERAERIQKKGFLKNLGFNISDARRRAEEAVRLAVVAGSLRNGPKDPTFDSALLQIAALRYPDDELVYKTVNQIQNELGFQGLGPPNNYLYRYLRPDDFGVPESAFLICSFWLVQALVKIGKLAEAQLVMSELMKSANTLGLFSEHYYPVRRYQAGNFPQAYSHVGQINAAFAVSPSWLEIL